MKTIIKPLRVAMLVWKIQNRFVINGRVIMALPLFINNQLPQNQQQRQIDPRDQD
jgi:hypothetical protein